MARSTPNQYPVRLTDDQRERFERLTRTGPAPIAKVRHARVLLLSDRDRPMGPLTRDAIADTLGMHVNTVDRLRKRFVLEGEEPALNRKVPASPTNPPKLDGHAEAHLVAICCSQAPEGRERWTLSLLAAEMKRRGFVTSISLETVRKTLKKTNCSRGGSSAGALRSASRRGL